MRKIFVTGIGTGVGKTLVSAILVEALKADYWKPIQAGNLDFTDSDVVKSLITNDTSKIHNEKYRLSKPMSPHAAAKVDGITISIKKISLPKTKNNIIIEGAGGLMVPLNKKELVIDMISLLNAEVVLVSSIYLGSINHTLLSIEALKHRKIKVSGIIFNGKPNLATETVILKNSCLPLLGRINQEKSINKKSVLKYAKKLAHLFFSD